MKKTLVALMVMVMGLSMTASALPAVTVDQCAGVADMQLQFQILIGLLGSEIDGLPAPEVLDIEGLGCADYAKISLLAAAMCEDAELAADFAANKTAFLGFVQSLMDLIGWAGASVDETTAAASNLATFTANPAYVAALQSVLTSMVGAEQAAGIIIMLTDEATCELLELEYIPAALTELAATLTGLGAQVPQNPYYAFAGALGTMVPDAFTALLSVSTELATNLNALVEAELLGDIRDYQEILAQISQIFQALAYTCANVVGQPAMAGVFAAFSGALDDGVDTMAAVALPTVPVLGVAKTAGEPFSALGDYDGDGVTNAVTYGAVQDAGAFVAAASGANPWYPGNPLLPAAGLVGLAVLVSAIAGGGAFVLRKK